MTTRQFYALASLMMLNRAPLFDLRRPPPMLYRSPCVAGKGSPSESTAVVAVDERWRMVLLDAEAWLFSFSTSEATSSAQILSDLRLLVFLSQADMVLGTR